jgi:pyruvate formate lyase activating enzyme
MFSGEKSALVFDIQRWSLHDGPGIRTIVFLKGCSLRCPWCSNPESQATYAEIAYFKDSCILCGNCIKNCPYNAIAMDNDGLKINFDICRKNCFRDQIHNFPCTSECYAKALRIFGDRMTVDQVFDLVIKDEGIFRSSGGGMTLSGGEPLLHSQFCEAILKKVKKIGINTAVETAGSVSTDTITQLIPYIDTILYDIKHVDQLKHLTQIGFGNNLILKNAKLVAELKESYNFDFCIRIPIIPGFNDTTVEIENIVKFVDCELKTADSIELLPYHRLGRGKYSCLGRQYQLDDMKPPAELLMETLNEIVKNYGYSTHPNDKG